MGRSRISDYCPASSPNGTKIHVNSDRGLTGDADEIYVTNLDGTDQTRLTSFNECQPADTSTCIRA